MGASALRALARDGYLVRRTAGRYELASVARYCAHLREVAAGRGGPEGSHLAAERARLAREQAEGHAMRNRQARGELLEADAVAREWGDILRTVRAGVLAVVSRVRSRLPHLTTHDAGVLDDELRQALTNLADGDARLSPNRQALGVFP